jgi:hypothetical protein
VDIGPPGPTRWWDSRHKGHDLSRGHLTSLPSGSGGLREAGWRCKSEWNTRRQQGGDMFEATERACKEIRNFLEENEGPRTVRILLQPG